MSVRQHTYTYPEIQLTGNLTEDIPRHCNPVYRERIVLTTPSLAQQR